jgi:hypothetical protein
MADALSKTEINDEWCKFELTFYLSTAFSPPTSKFIEYLKKKDFKW